MDPKLFAMMEHLEQTAAGILLTKEGRVEVLQRDPVCADAGNVLYISGRVWAAYQSEKHGNLSC